MDVRFGYWMPLGSGGMVITNLQQRTDWTLDWNIRMVQVAENSGYDYGLAPARFIASHGWEFQQEPTICTAVLATQTQRLKLISAVHTGLLHPAMIAKQLGTLDVFSKGRLAVNILSGWFKGEYQAFGVPWLEHDERYRQSEEFIQVPGPRPGEQRGRLLLRRREVRGDVPAQHLHDPRRDVMRCRSWSSSCS